MRFLLSPPLTLFALAGRILTAGGVAVAVALFVIGLSAAAVALLALAVLASQAHAADVFGTTVDFGPLISAGLEYVLLPVLAALAMALYAKLARWLKIETSDKANGLMHRALDRMVEVALAGARGPMTIDVKSTLAARVARTAIERIPDTLKALKVPEETLRKIIAEKIDVASGDGA